MDICCYSSAFVFLRRCVIYAHFYWRMVFAAQKKDVLLFFVIFLIFFMSCNVNLLMIVQNLSVRSGHKGGIKNVQIIYNKLAFCRQDSLGKNAEIQSQWITQAIPSVFFV